MASADTKQTASGPYTVILALFIWGLTMFLWAGYLAYLLPVRNYHSPGATLQFEDPATTLFIILMASFGVLIVLRSSSRLYGWLMLGTPLAIAFNSFTSVYGQYALLVVPEADLPLGLLAGWLQDFYEPNFMMFFSLVFLFPDGRLPSRRWRFIYWLVMGSWSAIALGVAFLERPLVNAFLYIEATVKNPYALIPAVPSRAIMSGLQILYNILVPLSVFSAVASLVAHWRRANTEVRQQIKWVLYFFGLALAAFAAYQAYGLLVLDAGNDIGLLPYLDAANGLTMVGVPVALGIAVLKYRLYDIDIIIRRTLVYSAISALLAGVYFGSVVLMQRLFRALTGRQSPLAVVISTLVIAALFTPLRNRVQNFVDRRFYRQKYDAQKTLERFGKQLRDEVDRDHLQAALVDAAQRTVQPESVSLWLNSINHDFD